jgi:hypothetical protein
MMLPSPMNYVVSSNIAKGVEARCKTCFHWYVEYVNMNLAMYGIYFVDELMHMACFKIKVGLDIYFHA